MRGGSSNEPHSVPPDRRRQGSDYRCRSRGEMRTGESPQALLHETSSASSRRGVLLGDSGG
jgi:hypothetical protein